MSSQSVNYSKLPWTFVFDADGDHAIFAGDTCTLIAVTNGTPQLDLETDKANAELICRAVNSHQQLVDALSEAMLQIEYLHGKFQETSSGNTVLTRIGIALARAEARP